MSQKNSNNKGKNPSNANSTVKVRNESRAGANNKSAKGKKAAEEVKKKESFASQIVPYILIVVAIFLIICFVTNAFCNPHNELDHGSEKDHIMGYVGYYVCEITIGFFGYAAFLIPLVLFNLAIFWKKYIEDDLIAVKSVLTVLTTTVASALIHICIHASDEDFSNVFVELYEDGAALYGGGVIGGYVGYALYSIANVAGAMFISIVVLIPLVLFLVGTTPQAMIDRIVAAVKVQIAKSREEKQNREEDEEYQRQKSEKAALKAQEKREKAERKAAAAAAAAEAKVGQADKDEEPEEAEEADFSDDDNDRIDEKIKDTVLDAEENENSGKGGMHTPSESENEVDEDELDISSLKNEESLYEAEKIDDDEKGQKSDGIKFVINNDTGEDIGAYGADDDAFGGAINNTGAGSLKVDKATGEVLSENAAGNNAAAEAVQEYKFPPIDLLDKGSDKYAANPEEIEHNTEILKQTLESFKIKIKEITCSCGPTITRYEIKPDVGVRVRQIANLVDDIALGLAKSGVRIEAPIPGKAAVGVEVPNDNRATVYLRNLIESPEFRNHKSKTAACLGADVSGRPVVFDIEKMPHLLVAGTTGSGKSICINSIIMSILFKAKPNEVKLVLIDPKKVEFNVYKDIPHLSCKIVSDPKKAAGALNSAVNEMEKRFELIEEVGVRNITGYNEITKDDPDKPFMPKMVIIIDELADLMMTAKEDVETAICRIAQKARAAGIHLILGTQRPSVDVITGLIKANVPSRIAFTVMSMVDSRTIIDVGGAEKLIGRGDMLYAPVGSPKPQRVQGAFVSDDEVERIVEYIKENNPPVVYDSEFENSIDIEAAKCGNNGKKNGAEEGFRPDSGDEDPKLYEAIELAIDAGKISTSLLQRRLEVGYGRAAKLIDRMEELGYVGPADGNKPRKILVTHQDIAEKMMNDGD